MWKTHFKSIILKSGLWISHSGGYGEFCLLGYNAMYYVNIQRTARRYAQEYRTLHNVKYFLLY
jgi:hypothetical protein